MKIYVSPLEVVKYTRSWRWRQKACLFVDTDGCLEDLHKFAKVIGMKPSWYNPSVTIPCYYISSRHFEAALSLGAKCLRRGVLIGVYARWKRDRKMELTPTEQLYELVLPEIDELAIATSTMKKAEKLCLTETKI